MKTYVDCVACLYREINGAGPFLMANAWGLEASRRGESGRVGPFYQITLLAGIHSKRVQELV